MSTRNTLESLLKGSHKGTSTASLGKAHIFEGLLVWPLAFFFAVTTCPYWVVKELGISAGPTLNHRP